jgi:hypothetical protein
LPVRDVDATELAEAREPEIALGWPNALASCERVAVQIRPLLML